MQDSSKAKRRAERELGHKLPDECRRCREHVEYVDDGADGVWGECGCDAGYLY